jgi:hypothetical protein
MTLDFRKAKVWLVSSAVLTLGAGCSTSYMPRTSGRIAVIQRAGTPSYLRDGKTYEGGLFGGELEEAVSGNPEAERHARAFKSGTVGGFVVSIVGAIGMGAGLAVAGSEAASPDPGNHNQLALGLVAGGIAAYVTGLALMFGAQPHMWDAINVYNDGLSASVPSPLPAPYPRPGVWPASPVAPAPSVAPAPVVAPTH